MYLARSIAHTREQLLMIINVDFAHAHKSEVRPPTHVYVACKAQAVTPPSQQWHQEDYLKT